VQAARADGIPVKMVNKRRIEEEARGESHQGVLAYVKARAYAMPEDIFALAAQQKEEPLIVALDGIEDPQNLGAAIRVAHQAGAHGVILSTRNSAPLTPAAVKASAGASEHTLVARVPSLPNVLLDVQRKQKAWIVGADSHEGVAHYDTRLTGPLLLIMGSEERGLSPLVRDRCDGFVKIPMKGKVDSLNVASATAVILFERLRQQTQGAPAVSKKRA